MTVHQTELHRQAKHYASVRTRLWGEPKRVMVKPSPDAAVVVPEPGKKSTLTTWEQQIEYIKARCRQMETCYREITESGRPTPRVVALRDQILIEVKDRWPRTQIKRLAALFQRKESGIRDVLAKLNISDKRPTTPADIARMRQLRAEGWSHARIGKELGVSHGTVGYHLGKKESA